MLDLSGIGITRVWDEIRCVFPRHPRLHDNAVSDHIPWSVVHSKQAAFKNTEKVQCNAVTAICHFVKFGSYYILPQNKCILVILVYCGMCFFRLLQHVAEKLHSEMKCINGVHLDRNCQRDLDFTLPNIIKG